MTYEQLVEHERAYLLAAGWTASTSIATWRNPEAGHFAPIPHGYAVNAQKSRDRARARHK